MKIDKYLIALRHIITQLGYFLSLLSLFLKLTEKIASIRQLYKQTVKNVNDKVYPKKRFNQRFEHNMSFRKHICQSRDVLSEYRDVLVFIPFLG